jgi:hypothetical protein
MSASTRFEVIPDARFELRVRQLAPVVVLGGMYLMFSMPTPAALGRIFLSMWVHELGHAASAWLCGFAALPGPWRTQIPQARSWWVLTVILGMLAWLGWRAWASEDKRAVLACAVGAALSVWLWQQPTASATQIIVFFGDGGGMVLGVALMACFFVRDEHVLHHTGLRWGLLGIGAAAFVDPARAWLRADDHDTIAFGFIEGVGDSDPSRLVDEHGWAVDVMVSRYQTLLWLCLAVFAVLYVRGIATARREVRAEDERAATAARQLTIERRRGSPP